MSLLPQTFKIIRLFRDAVFMLIFPPISLFILTRFFFIVSYSICGSLEVSQPDGPPRSVTGIVWSCYFYIFYRKPSATLTLSSILLLISSGASFSTPKFHFHIITSVMLEPTILRNTAMLPIFISMYVWHHSDVWLTAKRGLHCYILQYTVLTYAWHSWRIDTAEVTQWRSELSHSYE
jgi:hypothetical protein